jgi:hypothetical protein
MPLRAAAKRCPDAVFLPTDAATYEAASAHVMATVRSFPVVVEVWGWDEAFAAARVDDPEALAHAIRARVLAETGLSCSIGIGDTRLQAKTATGFAKPAGVAGKLPTTEEAKELVRDSLIAFNAAVQTKSFVDFHKQIAVMWQKQVTPERLAQLFDVFVKGEIDLSDITRLEPAFDKPPATNENGLLELKGSYPTQPSRVIFDLAYLYEGTEWKLVKINVNVRPPETEAGAKSSKKAAPKKEEDDDVE